MTINLENEQNLELPFDYTEVAQQVAEQVLELEQCPYEAEVEILLTNDEEIQRINREQRQIDRPTDVLSFPMTEFPVPADYKILEEDTCDAFDPDSGELLLGDIVISVERVYAQAEAYGHPLKREYAFLIAHSMLHLLGYDHMEKEEAAVMEEKQEKVLSILGITR